MSRHRNVRNLTEDDYYDDYDDDDYDDDDYYYQEDEYNRQQHEQPSQPAPTLTAIATSTTPKQQQPSMAEKILQLQQMGFTTPQAKTALGETKGNVEQATELLLKAASSSTTSKPPPGFLETKSSTTTAPTTPTTTTRTTTTTTTTPSKLPTTTTTSTTTLKKINVTTTTTTTLKQPTVDYGPLPKLPLSISAMIENQKSRLAMVVLGHVDAGKSTLMGQVLLQLHQVQTKTIQKYQKQAAELGKASFALAWVMDEDESE
jgi:hypothetical protein